MLELAQTEPSSAEMWKVILSLQKEARERQEAKKSVTQKIESPFVHRIATAKTPVGYEHQKLNMYDGSKDRYSISSTWIHQWLL